MQNTIFKLMVWGESHQPFMGATIEHLPPGMKLDLAFIQSQLERRKAEGTISTARIEPDTFTILSGFYQGYTTGTPFTIQMENQNVLSNSYEKRKDVLRPSHADYSNHIKSLGYDDPRGGGHSSGRLTAPLVVLGAIALQMLKEKGIYVASHIASMQEIKDCSFSEIKGKELKVISSLNQQGFPLIDQQIKEKMIERILNVKQQQDSVGATIESMIIGLPAGVGEPFFDSIESRISSFLFSIPAIKGVEFGLGFDFANYQGSQVNDAFYLQDGIKTKTNHNGGINGGISNGMPIIVKSVVKPTSSIGKPQQSVNIATNTIVDLNVEGRHDPCIASRVAVVVDSMIALTLIDLLAIRYGYLYFVGK